MAHDERRRFPRAPYESRVKEIVQLPQERSAGKANARDLSLGGMRLSCNEYLTQGQLVRLRFSLPWDLGQIESEAQVQWIIKEPSCHEIGIKFLNLKGDYSKAIERYVEEAKVKGRPEPFLVKFMKFFKKKDK